MTEGKLVPFFKIQRQCSFCRKPESLVKHLFESGVNKHCICEQCLAQAKLRLEESYDRR